MSALAHRLALGVTAAATAVNGAYLALDYAASECAGEPVRPLAAFQAHGTGSVTQVCRQECNLGLVSGRGHLLSPITHHDQTDPHANNFIQALPRRRDHVGQVTTCTTCFRRLNSPMLIPNFNFELVTTSADCDRCRLPFAALS